MILGPVVFGLPVGHVDGPALTVPLGDPEAVIARRPARYGLMVQFESRPDDQELGMGGTIVKLVRQGHKVHVVDMTNGEPTPRGSVETRAAEAPEDAKGDQVGLDRPRRAGAGPQYEGEGPGGNPPVAAPVEVCAEGDERRTDQDDEFIAAEAAHGRAGRGQPRQPGGDLLEQQVADVVAERVVDLLEVVEVEEEDRDAASTGPLVAGLGRGQPGRCVWRCGIAYGRLPGRGRLSPCSENLQC